MQLNVDTRTYGDLGVIVAAGEVDMATAGGIRQAITDLIGGGFKHLMLDMSEVSFIDSTGLGVIIGARKKVRHIDGTFSLVCNNPRTLRLFKITGIDQALPVHATRESAIAALDLAAPLPADGARLPQPR